MPIIQVPTIYRGHTRRETQIEVVGETLGECLAAAEAIHPGFRALVVDDAGQTHKFNKVLINGALLGREPEVLETPVGPKDEIEVMAAIAGG